jgi:hypothetical protein
MARCESPAMLFPALFSRRLWRSPNGLPGAALEAIAEADRGLGAVRSLLNKRPGYASNYRVSSAEEAPTLQRPSLRTGWLSARAARSPAPF